MEREGRRKTICMWERVGIGKIESTETWKKKMGKCQDSSICFKFAVILNYVKMLCINSTRVHAILVKIFFPCEKYFIGKYQENWRYVNLENVKDDNINKRESIVGGTGVQI